MGKNSRRKRDRRTWVRKTPDETWSRGPLRFERYGRYVHLTNTATPEEHHELLNQMKEAHKTCFENLSRDVVDLQKLLSKYAPLAVMERAAHTLVPLFLKYESESQFQGDEAYFLAASEYLQYLIARTPPSPEPFSPLTEDEWKALWNKAVAILQLTQTWLLTRPTQSNPPSELDMLRFGLDSRSLIIRVRRYPLFFLEHLRAALLPFTTHIVQAYGITLDDLVSGIGKLNDYHKTGFLERYSDVNDAFDALADGLVDAGRSPDLIATEEGRTELKAILETDTLREKAERFQEGIRLAFTEAAFLITDVSGLPHQLLSLLSVRPGESVLTALTGPNYDDLSPLSTSPLHYKPFIEVGGEFYSFFHSGFEDHIADIIEEDLLERFPDEADTLLDRKSEQLEAQALETLQTLLRPEHTASSAYYPNPDAVGGLTEIDGLILIDDVLLLLEAKSGTLSEGTKRGAPKSIRKDLLELIVDAHHQAERAERYIRSSDEVPFFDSTGRREIFRLRQSDVRRIIRVVVTREDLGWVGAHLATLSSFDPKLNSTFPWHISLDDLRIVAELFSDRPLQFLHYLETRLAAAAQTTLAQSDELEHVALYHKMNSYHDLPAGPVDRFSFAASYMEEIDRYFLERAKRESPEVPTQQLTPNINELVLALQESGLPRRVEAGSHILSFGAEGRTQLENGLEFLKEGLTTKRLRTMRLPSSAAKLGLTVSCLDDAHWRDELLSSAVQMEQSACERWLLVQIARRSAWEVRRIELLQPGRFSEADLLEARSRHEKRVKDTIARERPGRNDKCPCGSGEKFKRCHGR